MGQIGKLLGVLALSLYVLTVHAEQVQVTAINYTSQPGLRLGFELSGYARQHVFMLEKPARLVVDFENSRLLSSAAQPPAEHPLFSSIRVGVRNNTDLRLVFALKPDVQAKFEVNRQVAANQLQLDLTAEEKSASKPLAAAPVPPVATVAPVINKKESPANNASPSAGRAVKAAAVKPGRDIIVAIDAGHGGKDVGAQGINGVQEKDVVFAIAKRLENMVNRQVGMRAVMIRKGDNFVYLNDRVRQAQAAKADLLVSIHADACADPSVHGASVYTLANRGGASSVFARKVAEQENSADQVVGSGVDYKDNALASILQDLSQTAAREASQNVGSRVLKSVNAVGRVHKSTVQKAGFVVLKSQGIPSILVETAFISNPGEEQLLSTASYQDKMASAVFSGILSHFKQYASANTLMAQMSRAGRMNALNHQDNTVRKTNAEVAQAHTINQGETLASIAQQYGVTTRSLRVVNNISDANLRVGQVLQIPGNG